MLPLVSSACMPSPLPRQVRWTSFARTISILVGLPQLHGGSAPALHVSRPAQRLLTLWPARLPSRLATLYTESSDRFVTSAVVSVATGWSEPVPGRDFPPAEDQRLFTAHWRGGLGGAYLLPTLSSEKRKARLAVGGPWLSIRACGPQNVMKISQS